MVQITVPWKFSLSIVRIQILNISIQTLITPLTVFLSGTTMFGNALILVGILCEVIDWNLLESLLGLTFGDQMNVNCCAQEMIFMKSN